MVGSVVEVTLFGTDVAEVCTPVASANPDCLCSDFGFKMSEDLSLEVCVPDPEFSGKSYAPPVPCPVGSTYRRTRGYVSQRWPYQGCGGGGRGYAFGIRAQRTPWVPFIPQVVEF